MCVAMHAVLWDLLCVHWSGLCPLGAMRLVHIILGAAKYLLSNKSYTNSFALLLHFSILRGSVQIVILSARHAFKNLK